MIPLPQAPKIIKEEKNKALFEIPEFYPGYAVTVGNSLRRVLLSSLEGAAITQVKIDGVSHEFSTISGVLEDVVMILLNLKRLTFKCFSDEPQVISLTVKGEKEVTGADFKLTSEVELCNKEQHIATITKPTCALTIEAKVEKGVGYETVEKREGDKAQIGAIHIDSIFTPVKKVSLKVESMRVGKRTDFSRLLLEIETDGTITPKEALNQATNVLLGQFSVVADGTAEAKKEEKQDKEKNKPKEKNKTKAEKSSNDAPKTKVEDLDIADKIKKALVDNKVTTIVALTKKTEADLNKFDGIADKGIKDIKKALKQVGEELKK